MTFVDEFSHMIWLYSIKAKSDVFSIFKKLKSTAKRQSKKVLKVLRIDEGEEYMSNEFKQCYSDCGAKH